MNKLIKNKLKEFEEKFSVYMPISIDGTTIKLKEHSKWLKQALEEVYEQGKEDGVRGLTELFEEGKRYEVYLEGKELKVVDPDKFYLNKGKDKDVS